MKLAGLKIIRMENCIFAFILTLFAYSISLGSLDIGIPSVLASFSIFLLCAGGNAINDFFDYKIDSRNKPYRPIPSQLLTRKEALVISVILLSGGISAGYFVNSNVFMMAIAISLSLVTYASVGKFIGFSGNILISLLTASVFVVGAFVSSVEISLIILLVAAAAFTINLSREIVKDVEDYEADKGIKFTLPLKIGKIYSSKIAILFLGCNFLIAYVLILFYYSVAIFLLSAPLVVYLAYKIFNLLKDPNPENSKKAQKLIKYIMFIEFLFLFFDRLFIKMVI